MEEWQTSRMESTDLPPRYAQSFIGSISKLVIDHLVSEEVATAAADNPQELNRALRGISSSAQATRR